MKNKRPDLETFKKACEEIPNPHLIVTEFLDTLNYTLDLECRLKESENRALVAEKEKELLLKELDDDETLCPMDYHDEKILSGWHCKKDSLDCGKNSNHCYREFLRYKALRALGFEDGVKIENT
jgi:hypothetical protein